VIGRGRGRCLQRRKGKALYCSASVENIRGPGGPFWDRERFPKTRLGCTGKLSSQERSGYLQALAKLFAEEGEGSFIWAIKRVFKKRTLTTGGRITFCGKKIVNGKKFQKRKRDS